ncbi:ecdysone-induced protein 74EF isoform X2 [Salmo trutta]|uniref:ecdysone-induced protein 74EF isoform X2 n=1 Tax=Salmo trutta TaxID=8032 RepID=UPI0011326E1E|nr:ecdysone-induced protein 74EF-like isoform X2 [Salmo trutta]
MATTAWLTFPPRTTAAECPVGQSHGQTTQGPVRESRMVRSRKQQQQSASSSQSLNQSRSRSLNQSLSLNQTPRRSSRTDHSSTGANGGVNTGPHSHGMVANGCICKDCSIHSERKEALTTYSSSSSSQAASAAAAAATFSSSSQAASAAATSPHHHQLHPPVYTARSRVRGARQVSWCQSLTRVSTTADEPWPP